MSTKWLRTRILMTLAGLAIVLAILIPLNEYAWNNYQVTHAATPALTYQFFADHEICENRPDMIGWTQSKPNGVILTCTNDGAMTKANQPGKFSWWVGDWRLYKHHRFLGWWPVFRPFKWVDDWLGWLPCLFSGPDKCS